MDANASRSASATTSRPAHAHGDALIAVAEGNAESQPDQATLEHIFSCERCSQHVRDIRTGLAALGIKPGAAKKPAAPATTAPADALGGDALPQSIAADVALQQASAGAGDEDPARKMIWKVVLVGAVLAGVLYFLRSFATSLR